MKLETPRLRPASLEDYVKIQQLALAHASDIPSKEDWCRLWIDSPLRSRFAESLPIGWVLETKNGDVVGTMGTVWTLYTFRRKELVSAAGRFWFVMPPYRGLALQLMDQYFCQPVDLFINNTVAKDAYASFSQLSARIPLGEWDCMSYWLMSDLGDSCKRLKAAAGAQPGLGRSTPLTIETTDRFDSRFDVFWEELVRQYPEKLLAERSSSTLTWHFGAPMRKKQLWVITACQNNSLRAYCALTRQHHAFRLPALPHDDAHDMSAIRLVDFQTIEPDLDLFSPLLATALDRCVQERVVVLENFGRGVPKMRVLDDSAPNLKKLSNWKSFYSAADSGLDAELRLPCFWDLSAYDGDASFE